MIHVCAALIREQGKILITDRPKVGKWEFPGGKCEEKETVSQCIRRELQEELSLDVLPLDTVFDYVYAYPDVTVHLTFIRCIRRDGSAVIPKEGQHFQWVRTADLTGGPDFLEADKEIIRLLADAAKEYV